MAGNSSNKDFGLMDFVWRFVGALALVILTYNPTSFSYLHWVREAFVASEFGPVHLILGVLLLIGWTIFVVATRRSLGSVGVFLMLLFLGALVWLGISVGVLHTDSASAMTWIADICVALLLAVGLSWSHIYRRLSGQLEVDDAHD